MTATLTATPDLANWPPRMALNLSGFTGTTATVARFDAAGNRVVLRAANPVTLSGGGAVVFDYEVPDGKSSTWTATTATNTVTVKASMPASGPRLIHPGIPSLSQALVIVGMGDEVTDVVQGVHRPIGRERPIVITSGQRQAPTFDLTVLTGSEDDEDGLRTLLADTSTLLLQVGYDPSVGVSRTYYYWVSVGAVTKSRLSPFLRPDLGGDDFQWTLPCTVASRPSGLLQAQRTWADVAAEFATWADVAAVYGTWRDLILDNRSLTSLSVTADTVAVTDNGGGVLTLSGTGVADNGAGVLTLTLTSPGDVDNGDGTLTLI